MFKALSTQERNIHWGDNPLVIIAEIIKSDKNAAIKLKKEVVMSLLLFSNANGKGQELYKPNNPDEYEKEYLYLHVTLVKSDKNGFCDLLTLMSDDGGQTFWLKYADCTTFNTQIFQSYDNIPSSHAYAYVVYTVGVEQN